METQQHFYKNFPVSEEDSIILESLDFTGILQNTKEMEKAFKKLQAKTEEEKLQPYADLLFSYIKGIIDHKREYIKTDLLNQLNEGQKYPSFDLFNFNSVMYYETLKEKARRFQTLSPEEQIEFFAENRKQSDEIKENGYDWRIGTSTSTSHFQSVLNSVRIERIIKKTDIKRRLSNLFGTHYRVYLDSKGPVSFATGYYPYSLCLKITFKGDGPSSEDIDDILKVQKKYLAHTPYKLFFGENMEIEGFFNTRKTHGVALAV